MITRNLFLRSLTAALALAATALPLCAAENTPVTDIRITIHTSKGDIALNMFASKVPMTCANFLNLSKQGFYDGVVFHRVIPDFMIQCGDPLSKDPSMQPRWGTGGPGYRFADEIDPSLRHSKPGMLSMANAGPSTNGSQFFITHVPTPHLDGKHAVFGEVTKGQDVVNTIQKGDKIVSIEIHDSTDSLFAAQKSKIDEWNKVLKK